MQVWMEVDPPFSYFGSQGVQVRADRWVARSKTSGVVWVLWDPLPDRMQS